MAFVSQSCDALLSTFTCSAFSAQRRRPIIAETRHRLQSARRCESARSDSHYGRAPSNRARWRSIEMSGRSSLSSDLSELPEPGAEAVAPKGSAWWFTTAAYVLGALGMTFGPGGEGGRIQRALFAGLLMLASLAVVWCLLWISSRSRWFWTRWRKGKYYDTLYEIAALQKRGFEANQSLIRRFLSAVPTYGRISHSVYRGRVLLEVPKSGRRALPVVGQAFTLFDSQSGESLGTFEVTSSDGELSQLQDCGDVDPLFAGYAHSANATRTPEHMILVRLPEGSAGNE